jgi:hypothetical protein
MTSIATGALRRGREALRFRAAMLVLAVIPVVIAVTAFADAWPDTIVPRLGIDFQVYREAAARWLAGDGYFLPHQLAGPYAITHGDVLYPPPALILFVPFTILPAILWWIVPIGLTVFGLWRLRPAPWAWPIMGLALWWPETTFKLVTGNPVMWSIAFLSLGVTFAPFAALKLTYVPFSLLGSWDPRWRRSALLVGLMCLLFLPMWSDYVTALTNARHPLGVLYSFTEYPIVALPVVAWLASPRMRRVRPATMGPEA